MHRWHGLDVRPRSSTASAHGVSPGHSRRSRCRSGPGSARPWRRHRSSGMRCLEGRSRRRSMPFFVQWRWRERGRCRAQENSRCTEFPRGRDRALRGDEDGSSTPLCCKRRGISRLAAHLRRDPRPHLRPAARRAEAGRTASSACARCTRAAARRQTVLRGHMTAARRAGEPHAPPASTARGRSIRVGPATGRTPRPRHEMSRLHLRSRAATHASLGAHHADRHLRREPAAWRSCAGSLASQHDPLAEAVRPSPDAIDLANPTMRIRAA